MTLLLRNEEDVLAENIEYHLSQGVDFIIATNNRSTDGTEKILKSYESKGVLHYRSQDGDTHSQGRWVTEMARLAAKEFAADWVINNDADEFWWPTNHLSLKQALSSISGEYNIVEAARKNFAFLNTDSGNSFYQEMVYRDKESFNALGRPLPPKQAHVACEDIIVAEGNHSVQGLAQPCINKDIIEIFHFPIRSSEQFTRKIKNGGAALARNTELADNIGSTWRSLYKELLESGSLGNYLGSQVFDAEKLEKQLEMGKIVEDRRLKNYLDEASYLIKNYKQTGADTDNES